MPKSAAISSARNRSAEAAFAACESWDADGVSAIETAESAPMTRAQVTR
ncbi:MAG: hypothetical protein ACRD09_02520 [Vicinamibacterales bacterium]